MYIKRRTNVHPGTAHPTSLNLPHRLTRFIGRDVELVELRRLLQERELVTLTGAGGSGKTRLAIEFASTLAEAFPGGIFFVELASLSRPELVVETIARVLGVEAGANAPLIELLTGFLRNRKSLLVLDNCEHLIDTCARLAGALLAACPDLYLLATSRELLGIGGECIFRVPLLSLPAPSFSSDPERITGFESVQLFADRARLADPAFVLTENNAREVAQVCIRLDGIPLALELAAASLRALTVSQLADRLDQRFRLLTSGDRTALPRQQTLKAMLDWSHTLLAPVEQTVFRRLALFPGDWTLDAAEYICAGTSGEGDASLDIEPEEVLSALVHLVDKSLIQLDTVTGRYRMLETIRLYALAKLEESGETQDVRSRHLDWYLRFVEDGSRRQGTGEQHEWYGSLEAEQDNIRAALTWAVDGRLTAEAARLALIMRPFWMDRAYLREAMRWFEQILATSSVTPAGTRLKAQLLSASGSVAHTLNRFELSNRYHAEALQLWHEQGDQAGITATLLDLGWQNFQAIDLATAERYALESLALARTQGDPKAIGAALNLLGVVRAEGGNPQGAVAAIEESLDIWRGLGALNEIGSALMTYGRAEQELGNLDHACSLLLEALHLQISLGTYTGLIGCLSIMMHFARDTCRPPEKYTYQARIIGVFQALEEKIGGGRSHWMDREAGPLYGKLTEELGEAGLARELDAGRSLTTEGILALGEEIVRYVRAITRAETPPPEVADSPPDPALHSAGLTPREVEVLRLVAGGLTNRQAADRLSVTSRTINAHLTSIYSKIGVTSRAGAVRFALEHRLA
jgi:predicted ATPase/DNA-binding CsgD family transcriptional regulator